MTDDDLEGFRNGDHAAFRTIVEVYSPRLLNIVRSFASDDDEAMDLLQDVWTRAFSKRTSYDGRGSLVGWLLSVARSVCLSKHRARRTASVSLREATGGSTREHPPWTSTEESPVRMLERREAADRIRIALLELSERQREVVVLRLLEGRSTRATAQVMQVAEGTVKATLHQALTALRRVLHEERA